MASVNKPDALQRLLGRTKKNGDCMEFTGYRQSNGYSRATVSRKTDYGHRHVYRLVHGEIPSGMDVCHECDNRSCINPKHLFIGSRKDLARLHGIDVSLVGMIQRNQVWKES